MSGQVKSSREVSNQVGIGQVISGQVDSSMDILSHVGTVQIKSGQVKSTWDKSSNVRTSKVRTGPNMTGQIKTCQGGTISVNLSLWDIFSSQMTQ